MLFFMDGFDYYTTADISLKWNVYTAGGAAHPTVGAYGRFGTNGIKLSSSYQSMQKAIDDSGRYSPSSLIYGFAVKIVKLPSTARMLVAVGQYTRQLEITINPTGTLSLTQGGTAITGGTTSTSLTVGSWYFIEWLATPSGLSNGSDNIIKINGVDALVMASGSPILGYGQGGGYLTSIFVGSVDLHSDYEFHFDDVYVLGTTAGTHNNTWIGDCRVLTVAPVSDASQNGTSLIGAPTNWQAMDDIPSDGSTSYAIIQGASDANGGWLSCGISSLAYTPTAIYGVQPIATARQDSASKGINSFAVSFTSYLGPINGLTSRTSGSSFGMVMAMVESNSGSAWTASSVSTSYLLVQCQDSS